MLKPNPSAERTVSVGDGHDVNITETMQNACDTAAWAAILDNRHPGNGYLKVRLNALEVLRKELRKQIPLNEDDPTTRFGRSRLAFLADWLGCWNIPGGCHKINENITPVSSTMDIRSMPECAKHGLMHECGGA